MQYFGGINDEKTHKDYSKLNSENTETSYKADETPIQTNTGIENMGLAVFNDDKLVRRTNRNGMSMSFNFSK